MTRTLQGGPRGHRINRRRVLSCLVCVLALSGVIEGSRRLLLSHSLYELNLAVGARLATLPPPRAGERVLIFAPHPDDETLGTGAFVEQAVAAGADTRVAVVTNAEYPEMSVVISEKTIRRRREEFIRLGYARQRETQAAMARLGLPPDHITFLGYPNGYLDRMWLPAHWQPNSPVTSARTRTTRSPYSNSLTPGAIYCGQALLDDVKRLLLYLQPDVVIALHPNDVHGDHWPTGAFVRAAIEDLRLTGHGFAARCQVYSYLIHRNHWPVPRGYKPWLTLEPPASLLALGTTDWRFLPVSLAQTIDKHSATAMYRTQGGGIDPLLKAFARATELYGIVPVLQWPPGEHVPPLVAIRDTQRDLDSAARRPYADIVQVTLSRHGGRFLADVVTRGVPGSKTGYHLSLRVGAASPSASAAVVLDWRDGRLQGSLLSRGTLTRLPPDALQLSVSGRTMRVQCPWLVPPDAPAYLMVRAWTTAGKVIADQTAFATFRVDRAQARAPAPRRE